MYSSLELIWIIVVYVVYLTCQLGEIRLIRKAKAVQYYGIVRVAAFTVDDKMYKIIDYVV